MSRCNAKQLYFNKGPLNFHSTNSFIFKFLVVIKDYRTHLKEKFKIEGVFEVDESFAICECGGMHMMFTKFFILI